MVARTRPTPRDAFRLARRTLLDGQRLDMQALAGQLGINRVTLYRWVGSREQLLVDVLWCKKGIVLVHDAYLNSFPKF